MTDDVVLPETVQDALATLSDDDRVQLHAEMAAARQMATAALAEHAGRYAEAYAAVGRYARHPDAYTDDQLDQLHDDAVRASFALTEIVCVLRRYAPFYDYLTPEAEHPGRHSELLRILAAAYLAVAAGFEGDDDHQALLKVAPDAAEARAMVAEVLT